MFAFVTYPTKRFYVTQSLTISNTHSAFVLVSEMMNFVRSLAAFATLTSGKDHHCKSKHLPMPTIEIFRIFAS